MGDGRTENGKVVTKNETDFDRDECFIPHKRSPSTGRGDEKDGMRVGKGLESGFYNSPT
jgi:hypothetical protein